jgi:hypothetical protein
MVWCLDTYPCENSEMNAMSQPLPLGPWSLTPDPWPLVPDPWSLTPDPRSLSPGRALRLAPYAVNISNILNESRLVGRLHKRSDTTSAAIEPSDAKTLEGRHAKRSDVFRAFRPRLIPDPRSLTPAHALHLAPYALRLCLMRRSHSLIPLLLAFLVLLGLPATSPAQTTERTFTPRISVDETYDDNIDLTHTNEKSDWITTVSPGFNLAVNTQHTKLNLDVSGGRSFYLDHSSRDATRLGTTLSLNQQVSSRLSVLASDTFARTEEPLTAENGLITNVSQQRVVRYYNTGETGLSYQFGPENRATFGYRNRLFDSRSDQEEDSLGSEGFFDLVTWFGPRFGTEITGSVLRATFDQPSGFTGAPTEDFYNYTGEGTLNYRWERSRRVYVRYQILDHRPDQTSVETGALDYRVHQGTLGTSLALGPHTTLDADGGYFFQDLDGGDNQSGPAFHALLTTRQERLTLRLGGAGGYDESYFTSENLGFAKYYQALGSLDYRLTEPLAVFASGSYRWEKYYGAVGQNADRTDKTWQTVAGFRYSFLRYLTLSLDGTHTERSSDVREDEFTDNRGTLRLTWAYGIPF